jgi:DNA-directed RNA polymerase subunit RPC12/RpoP
MSTKTQTVEKVTEHGSVEYEVVRCSSCEQQVSKEDAQRFIVGDATKRKHWSHRDKIELEFRDDSITEGWACPHCSSGPAQFPTDSTFGGSNSTASFQNALTSFIDMYVFLPRQLSYAMKESMDLDEMDREMLGSMFIIIQSVALISLIAVLL